VRQQVPYTVTRKAMGAYMVAADAAKYQAARIAKSDKGQGEIQQCAAFEPSPGRLFVEGGNVIRDVVFTTTRMCPRPRSFKVPYKRSSATFRGAGQEGCPTPSSAWSRRPS